MFGYFTDCDGKFQLGALAKGGFDPISRFCRFKLTEEAHQLFDRETGISRAIDTTCAATGWHRWPCDSGQFVGRKLLLCFGAKPRGVALLRFAQDLPKDMIDVNFAFSRVVGQSQRYVEDVMPKRSADLAEPWRRRIPIFTSAVFAIWRRGIADASVYRSGCGD